MGGLPLGANEIMAACAFSSPGIEATSVCQLPAVWSVLAMRWPALTWLTEEISWILLRSGVRRWVAGSPEQIMAGNVLGTWHVLLAAEAAGVTRVIHFSSAQVFGIADGERFPDYFPVDDAHPRRAMRPYGLSKCLAEDLCAGFTARTGIVSVSLRPVAVWGPGEYRRIEMQWRAEPRSEWEPFWEYGAFVDVRDVGAAVELALTVPLAGHYRAGEPLSDVVMTWNLTFEIQAREPELGITAVVSKFRHAQTHAIGRRDLLT